MKKTIITLILVLLCFGLQAKPVDVETAKSLGIKFMTTNTEIKADVAQLSYTAYTDRGEACFYVFSMEPKGFVIVSADDRAMPILGYSTESRFSVEEIADGLQSFFRNYQAGFSQMMAADEERTAEAVRDWERLAATGKVNNTRLTRTVPQLLKTIWNQSALYNDLCPYDTLGPNNHVYAGCVATAMAQVMNYWQWPQTGKGSNSYTCYPYGDLWVDFETATYRFDLMPEFLDWTSKPEEIHAVALLQYHAGVSVDMGYSPEGSGAASQSVASALEYNFRYDGSMNLDYKDWHTNSEWDNLLRENLDGGMPLYYSASGPDGGHAFVCDGYDDSDMFHFNWGWQGLDNGYYAINGFYLSHYSFPDWHAALFGIFPDFGDYCVRPLPVENLLVEEVAAGSNRITFTAPSMTYCEFGLDEIDSIVIMRNNEVVYVARDVAAGDEVSFVDNDALGICHYSVCPWSYGSIGDFKRDTILNGPTCELTFHLHDSVGDGWIAKSISLVDSRGNAITRLGLANGSNATVTVEVPSDDELSLHWAYSIGGKDNESYFEVYHWNGGLLYATNGRPYVGELCRFVSDCMDAVEETEVSALSLYPNPVSAQLTIEGVEVAQVEVFNMLGQMVGLFHQNEISFSGFVSGVYFLRVTSTEGQVFFEKVIKK